MSPENYQVEPVPRIRRFSIDAGRLGRRSHITHALIEVDVTDARQLLRAHKAQSGESLSFTGFIINCLGQAIDENKHLQAYLNWRNQLVIFDDVNVVVMIEIEHSGQKVPRPHIIKSVNHKSYREIHKEIRAVQAQPAQGQEFRYISWLLMLPWFLRRLVYWSIMKFPQRFRKYSSSVLVTAVGMFGHGGGWGITMPSNTLTVAVGGLAKKPGVVDGEILIREYLDLTISMNHDIVDGAPQARFVNRFRELIESGYGLTNGIRSDIQGDKS